jgi:hypothetical protein
MTRYQRLRRAIAGQPVNRWLTPAELQRAAQARQAVETDRAASELPWRWIAKAALVVIPLTIAVQFALHAWGCTAC